MFKKMQSVIDELNLSNSSNDKIETLMKYKNDSVVSKFLYYTYSPLKQFYVTSKAVLNFQSSSDENIKNKTEDGFFDLLDSLSKREITGHAALSAVKYFIELFPDFKDLIINIIDKNLKIRMSATSINKVFPYLIPEFKVQLAEKINNERQPDFELEDWFWSKKYDSCRCISICKDGDVKLFSRTGKEFLTLGLVADEIKKEIYDKKLFDYDFVLDGEICILDENGNENFTNMMKEIRKKDHTIKNPVYKIFDIIKLNDFIKKESPTIFSRRYQEYKSITSESGILQPVEQTKIKNKDHLEEMVKFANDNGWEGLIIKKDSFYEGKRSKKMLKVKTFLDAEYKVLEVETGMFRIISPVTGLEVEEEMLSNVIIEHKGSKVSVGSGFSIEERMHYFDNPNEIIGKKITVKYFEETVDQNGKPSLRFPVLKAIYGVERDI